MTRVLAFDIGIKNLAWCVAETSTNKSVKILGWDNYNLLSESSNVEAIKQTCPMCKNKGVYETTLGMTCSKHCPAEKPALRDCSGGLLKKIPKVSEAVEILKLSGTAKPPTKKSDVVAALKLKFSIPLETKKVSKAADVGLTEIHNSLQSLVKQNAELWKTCTTILLENQPVFKNPTMKSVQMLLFATLRDLVPSCPPLKLVHAGKKSKGAAKGDEGYKDRKAGSEARVDIWLKTNTDEQWQNKWQSATKKSDLADAFSMCLDAMA
jgi:hypothetical protein